MTIEKQKAVYWPDNTYFLAFCGLFILAALLRGGFLTALTAGAALGALLRYFRVSMDEHFVTSREIPGLVKPVILPRSEVRALRAERGLGPALVLDDKTSVQEVILYAWAFSAGTLRELERVLEGGSS